MLDYGEMKNNLLVYKSKEQIADICIAYYKEIERLHSIIKEVREYIKDNTIFIDWFLGGNRKVPKIELTEQGYMKLLEILDKENI